MQVILIQDVPRTGTSGEVIKVKDGFARNYLFPLKLAVPVTEAALKRAQELKQKALLQLEKAKQAAETLKDKLAALSLTIPVLTQEEDKLYGSINTAEIVSALKDEGFELEKTQILLDNPIKALGIYEIPVKLHPDVMAKIKIWVVKK